MAERNRAAIVTGGTGGLGKSVTKAFLQQGWQVLVTYVEQDEFNSLLEECEEHRDALRGALVDLTQSQEVKKLAECVRREFPNVQALVNVIGGFAGGQSVTQTPEAVWDLMIRLNLKTVFLACKTLAPVIADSGGGTIVNIGARAGRHLVAGMAAYGVSKAGVCALTEVLAEELRPENIRVNCILPSIIDTEANRHSMPDADFSKWVTPAEIARLILFLVSDEAKKISGAAIPIYGDA